MLLGNEAGRSIRYKRDVLLCGSAVGVLAIDLERGKIVLTRQFRLSAYLAAGETETVEIVAGRIDFGKVAAQGARRECFEEATQLAPILELSLAPRWSDEFMTLFPASVDVRRLPVRAGARNEQEEIAVVCCGTDDAIGLVEKKAVHSAPTIMALQWPKLNRHASPTAALRSSATPQ